MYKLVNNFVVRAFKLKSLLAVIFSLSVVSSASAAEYRTLTMEEGEWLLGFTSTTDSSKDFTLDLRISNNLTFVLDPTPGTMQIMGSFTGDLLLGGTSSITKIGEVTNASLNMTYSGVDFDVDPLTGRGFDAIGRTSTMTFGELSFQTNQTTGNEFDFNSSFSLDSKFATISSNSSTAVKNFYNEVWHTTSGSAVLPSVFQFVLGSLASNPNGTSEDLFASWITQAGNNITLNGHEYTVFGDMFGFKFKDVPEPATMALLGLGMLGGAVSRKRKSA